MTAQKESELNEFEKLARPLIAYLNEHHHPHTHIVITTVSAEISEGVQAFTTADYIRG
jgi:myosin-crossreactive antigen